MRHLVLSVLLLLASPALTLASGASSNSSVVASHVDVVNAKIGVSRLSDSLQSATHILSDLELRMDMTYTNRTKYVWFQDLAPAEFALQSTLQSAERALAQLEPLVSIDEVTPQTQFEVAELSRVASYAYSEAQQLASLSGALRYWKDRIINELDSRTYITLDERDLIDRIDVNARHILDSAETIKSLAKTLELKLGRF